MVKITHRESLLGEFDQASFLSFLFPFRATSGTLQMVRSFSSDVMDTFSPQPEEALIGARTVAGEDFLIAKLSWRKNLPSGCILRRPCFCGLHAAQAAQICPVHAFLPRISRRVELGRPLFRGVNRRTFSRISKAILGKLRISEASRYSSPPPCFSQGTAQEVKESGPPGRRWRRLACGAPLPFGGMSTCPETSRSVFNSCSEST